MLKYLEESMNKGKLIWLLQRFSAVFILLFVFSLLYYASPLASLVRQPQELYWQQVFIQPSMIVLTALFLLSLVVHTWIGMWSIITDYIDCPFIARSAEYLVVAVLLAVLLWGIRILIGL